MEAAAAPHHTKNKPLGRLSIAVSGMTCAACALRVEKALRAVPGVRDANVNLAMERASVNLVPGASITLDDLVSAVDATGFEARTFADETRVYDLRVSGMTCGACSARLERALAGVPGVLEAAVNLATEKARVVVADEAQLRSDDILEAVVKTGFAAELVDVSEEPAPDDRSEDEPAATDAETWLLGLAFLLSAPFLLQMVAMPTAWHFDLPAYLQLALATPVQFVAGRRFYGPAWRAARALSGNMDLLVVLGTTATYALSTYFVLFPANAGGALYFEASSLVITLVLLGKWLEARAKRSTTAAIRGLMRLRPATATIRSGGIDREVAISEVRLGDFAVVKPGERIPVDGVVEEGASHVDESLITGESLPVPKETGQSVTGGALNGEGLLIVRTTAVGRHTMLSRIIRLIEETQGKKAPVQHLVDRVAGVFVPAIIMIAFVTLAAWLGAGLAFETSLINAVTVLVIACPCALGLATPTAIMVGTGVAAGHGILIREAEALERARNIDTVVFDKTGTLTQGKPSVAAIAATGDEDLLLGLAASAQLGSEHPIAKALLDAARERDLQLMPPTDFRALPGRGIRAGVGDHDVIMGSRRLMAEEGVSPGSLESAAKAFEEEGKTVVWIAIGGNDEASGTVAVGDTIKDGAERAVARLRDENITVVMLTGDNARSAAAVATDLGIETTRAEVLPERKASEIEDLRSRGRTVAMVGDGLNDAPALAAADLGIAMGSGTDVAMETAGITLMRSDPALVADALSISRATYRKIRQNLFWAFIYNVVAIPLAALGHLSPAIAGAAMALSSVSVVTNSLVLKRWKPEQDAS